MRVNGKITLYCKGAGTTIISRLSITICHKLYAVSSLLLPSLDSVVFARLNKESQPLKKTTMAHLTVRNPQLFLHLLYSNFLYSYVGLCKGRPSDSCACQEAADGGRVCCLGWRVPESNVSIAVTIVSIREIHIILYKSVKKKPCYIIVSIFWERLLSLIFCLQCSPSEQRPGLG